MQRVVGALALVLIAAAACALLAAASSAAPPTDPPGQGQNANAHDVGRPAENMSSGNIAGTFVSLRAPLSANVLEAYTSDGVAFLDGIAVPGYVLEEKAFQGPVVSLRGPGVSLDVHDVQSAVLRVSLNASMSAVFDIANGVHAGWDANESLRLTVDGSNHTAAVWTNCQAGALTLDAVNGTFAVFAADSCRVFLRSQINENATESLVAEATQTEHVAAEVSVGPTPEDGYDVSSYGETTVTVTHTPDRVVVTVSSPSNEPASFVIRLAEVASPSSTVVLVDGAPAARAGTLQDSLDPTDDGTAIEYAIDGYGETTIVVVSMPAPQGRVIEIKSGVAAEPSQSTPILGAALGLAFAAAAAVVLFRKR